MRGWQMSTAGARNAALFAFAAFIYAILHVLAYSGALSPETAAAWNETHAKTPLFNFMHSQLSQLTSVRFPVIPLVALAPMIMVFVFSAAIISRNEAFSLPSIFPPLNPFFMIIMKFLGPIVLVATLINISLGLPLGEIIFGADRQYDFTPLLINNLIVMAAFHLSIFLPDLFAVSET